MGLLFYRPMDFVFNVCATISLPLTNILDIIRFMDFIISPGMPGASMGVMWVLIPVSTSKSRVHSATW